MGSAMLYPMHKLRNQAIAMRLKGSSFNEINEALGIGKGTLSYMLRTVPLTDTQRDNLIERSKSGLRNFANNHEAMSERNRKSAQTRKQRDPDGYIERMRTIGTKGRLVANLTYLDDELLVKEVLEKIYDVKFSKEQIGNRFIDFASTDLLIEFTKNGTRGLSDAIDRLEEVKHDPRKKIAYVDTRKLGLKRRARLEKISTIIDYRAVFPVVEKIGVQRFEL